MTSAQEALRWLASAKQAAAAVECAERVLAAAEECVRDRQADRDGRASGAAK